MKKLLVITAYDRRFAELAGLSVPTMKDFCKNNKGDFKEFYVEENPQEGGWIKIPPIIESLNSGYEYVLWLDVDVIVARPEALILSEAKSGHDLYMCWHEFEGNALPAHYNAGVMLIRSTPWSRRFFKEVQSAGQLAPLVHNWMDQATILHLMGYDDVIGYGDRREDPKNCNRMKVGKLDWNWNSIVGAAVGADPIIHHYAGINSSFRCKLMEFDADFLAARKTEAKAARLTHLRMLGELRLLDDIRVLDDESRSLNLRNEALEREIEALGREINRVERPPAWRLTKYLRLLKRLFRPV